MKLGSVFVFIFAVAIAAGFLSSGLSVGVDPRTHAWLALWSMTFPAWLAAMVAISLIAVVSRGRKSLIVLLVAWVACIGKVCEFSPMHWHDNSANEPAIKIMTYNVFMFLPQTGEEHYDYNLTLSSIIKSGADIVAIQEANPLDKPNPRLKITASQCDSLKSIYPYTAFNPNGLALLSTFPFESVELAHLPSGTAQFAAYKVHYPGKDFFLYNIHLQSFRLCPNDRRVYYEMTDGEVSRKILSEARHEIIPKVKGALRSHANEAEMLVTDIRELAPDGTPVVVCGDFNDVPGSFPMRLLEKECGLNDAYAEGAFGPTYTYHGSRLYFNIDHILYRGFGKPFYTGRLKVPSSDHYPLITKLPVEDLTQK